MITLLARLGLAGPIVAGWIATSGCARSTVSLPLERAAQVRASYLAGLDTLAGALVQLDRVVLQVNGDLASRARAQTAFAEARAAYKRVELLVEYYSPTAAEQMDGPALPQVDDDDPGRVPRPPEGFQVIEESLFPTVDVARKEEISNEVRIVREHVRRSRRVAEATLFNDANVFAALRLELARVTTLGIAGFDSPVALRSMPAAAAAIGGVQTTLAPYTPDLTEAAPAISRSLQTLLAQAVAYLNAHPDFDTFDHLQFTTRYARPALMALQDARRALGIGVPIERAAWSPEIATPFERGAFDPTYFAPTGAVRPAAELVALGRRLFLDRALSGPRTRACASCHRSELAFTDGLARSPALEPRSGVRLRNAPTLINAGLQVGVFADLRTQYLEDQVTQVVSNPDEMHGSLEAAASELAHDSSYGTRFATAFHRAPGSIAPDEVRAAIAAYVRALLALDSRVDRYLQGEHDQLTDSERHGFNLFMGKARCGTCHFAPLFNGTLPPVYDRTEVEVLGVPQHAGVPMIDPDEGRFAVDRIPLHRHAFKPPTVRNVALTAPYLHNGVFRTLEEVVNFYDAGGGLGLGIRLEHQTLPPDSLHLDPGEKRDLVAFLRALTDTAGIAGIGVTARHQTAR